SHVRLLGLVGTGAEGATTGLDIPAADAGSGPESRPAVGAASTGARPDHSGQRASGTATLGRLRAIRGSGASMPAVVPSRRTAGGRRYGARRVAEVAPALDVDPRDGVPEAVAVGARDVERAAEALAGDLADHAPAVDAVGQREGVVDVPGAALDGDGEVGGAVA